MMLAPGGRCTKVQVLLRRRASYSSCVVRCQWGSLKASQVEEGIGEMALVAVARLKLFLGCRIPILALVTMGWLLGTGEVKLTGIVGEAGYVITEIASGATAIGDG